MTTKHARTFGGLIASDLKKMTRHDDGNVVLSANTAEHDLALLRSIADAVRVDDEFASLLVQYAEVMNRQDEAEREGRFPEIRALQDEATDLASEIDAGLEWSNLGDDLTVYLTERVASELEEALVESKPEPRPALTTVGGAA